MPSLVYNRLKFSGQPDKIQAVANLIKSDLENDRFDLLKLLPLPEKAPSGFNVIATGIEKGSDKNKPKWYNNNWLAYNEKTFGIKWVEFDDVSYQIDKNKIEIIFLSPWFQINDATIKKLSTKYRIDVQNDYYDWEVYQWYGTSICYRGHCQNYHSNYDFNFDFSLAQENESEMEPIYRQKRELFLMNFEMFVMDRTREHQQKANEDNMNKHLLKLKMLVD